LQVALEELVTIVRASRLRVGTQRRRHPAVFEFLEAKKDK
jgi:hypothetical protein